MQPMAASLWLLHSPSILSSLSLSNHSSCFVCKKQAPTKCILLICSSSALARSSNNSSSVVTEEAAEAIAAASSSQQEEESVPAVLTYSDDPNFRGCKGCGREEIEAGCNGEGRIQGGIATIPGFGWWPIKAYRPCPGFVAAGGRYRRQGQSMDDVASGRAKKVLSNKKSENQSSPRN